MGLSTKYYERSTSITLESKSPFHTKPSTFSSLRLIQTSVELGDTIIIYPGTLPAIPKSVRKKLLAKSEILKKLSNIPPPVKY